MGDTITGAASGENAYAHASPKGSKSQAKGQKNNKGLFVVF